MTKHGRLGTNKVRTGCQTCRIRKVKCDEGKPSCQKCASTGRTCDGYSAQFIAYRYPSSCPRIISPVAGRTIHNGTVQISNEDIKFLERCFSTKTMFNVTLDCSLEAEQLLQASFTDKSTSLAIASLKAFRCAVDSGHEIGGGLTVDAESRNGLLQYCAAMRSVASATPLIGESRLRSALLCCQVFVSIEQSRQQFAVMTRHIIQGLRIMRTSRIRPMIIAPDRLIPSQPQLLPYLDVFVIKLFMAPCNFSKPSTTSSTPHTPSVQSCYDTPISQATHRIAPAVRGELTQIGSRILDFLTQVSKIKVLEDAKRLLLERATLLEALSAWENCLHGITTSNEIPGLDFVSTSFLHFFHRILEISVLGALESSPIIDTQLRIQDDRLSVFAGIVESNVQLYKQHNRDLHA